MCVCVSVCVYLRLEGPEARVATHDGPKAAGGAIEMEAGVVEEVDWSRVIALRQKQLQSWQRSRIMYIL